MDERAAGAIEKDEEPASETPICRFVFAVLMIIVIPMAGAVFFIVDEDWDFVSA